MSEKNKIHDIFDQPKLESGDKFRFFVNVSVQSNFMEKCFFFLVS